MSFPTFKIADLDKIDGSQRRKKILRAATYMGGAEEVFFYFSVRAYRENPDLNKANLIYDTFVSPASQMSLNINKTTRDVVKGKLLAVKSKLDTPLAAVTLSRRMQRNQVNKRGFQRSFLDQVKNELKFIFESALRESFVKDAVRPDLQFLSYCKREQDGNFKEYKEGIKKKMDEFYLNGIII